MSEENVRPPSITGRWRTDERKRLQKRAEYGKPKAAFSASAMGAECRREVMYNMLGYKKRPLDPKDEMIFRAGDVYHTMLQNKWPDTYKMDGVECIFGEDKVLWNHLQGRADELDAKMELKEYPIEGQIDPVTGEPLVIRSLQYTLPCTDDEGTLPVTIRVRPDMILMGLAGHDGYWEPDQWVVGDIKSTREANIKRLRQACKHKDSHILQVQISMHLFGLKAGMILVVGRDGCTLLGDEYQKAYKNSSKPWAEHPEFQWPLLEYSPALGKGLQRRLAMWERDRLRLQPIADEYGLDSEELAAAMPTYGCGGRGDWKFNYCDHSCKQTINGTSQAMCPGGA